jgi:hypothetical protein
MKLRVDVLIETGKGKFIWIKFEKNDIEEDHYRLLKRRNCTSGVFVIFIRRFM